MYGINEAMKAKFISRLEYAQLLYKNGEDEILQRMYCRFVPDASEEQGKALAAEVMEKVGQYEQKYKQYSEATLEELKTVITDEFSAMLKGRSLVDQCNALYRARQGMGVMNMAQDGKISVNTFYSGFYTEEARNELLDKLVNEITREEASQIEMPAMLQGSERAFLKGMNDTAYRAVLAVSFYTVLREENAADGAGNWQASIDHVVANVCACTLTDQNGLALKHKKCVNWAVARWFIGAALLAALFAVIMTVDSVAIIVASYFVCMWSIIAMWAFTQEQLNNVLVQKNYLDAENWVRAKVKEVAEVRENLIADDVEPVFNPALLPG